MQQFFEDAGIYTSLARRKTIVQLESMGGLQALPCGIQGWSREKFLIFCILNSSKHRSCGSATTNRDKSLQQKSTLLRVWGVWVWDPKPVYRLQNSSGYGTIDVWYTLLLVDIIRTHYPYIVFWAKEIRFLFLVKYETSVFTSLRNACFTS